MNHDLVRQFLYEESFQRAEDLLRVLALHEPRWNPRNGSTWYFRGQGNSTWDLEPSAFRPDANLNVEPGGPIGPCRTHGEQVKKEFELLRMFLLHANEQGLSLPSAAEKLWTDSERDLKRRLDAACDGATTSSGNQWPRAEWRPLLGLAQHHGIPTRLLDWSANPFISTYFGAKQALSPNIGAAPNGRLAVWAFRYEPVFNWDLWKGRPERVRRILAPAGSNRNLYAQSGAFTVILSDRKGSDPAHLPPLNRLLERELLRQDTVWLAERATDGPVLYKLTLAVAEAPRLLRLLARSGISATTLFPGFDGVSRGIDERRLWDSPHPYDTVGTRAHG